MAVCSVYLVSFLPLALRRAGDQGAESDAATNKQHTAFPAVARHATAAPRLCDGR